MNVFAYENVKNVNDGKLSKNKKKQSNNKEDEIHIIPDLISLDVSNENELKFPENFMRLYSPDNKFQLNEKNSSYIVTTDDRVA